jgi:nitroimidazol reductase NimA-like FMN-containing flavoprotein (pyridoxamine 5'-phosphate oxidase superfamily)
MRITEMTLKECREILARTGFGRLGCSRNNQPYVVPIYFAYEPDQLYGFSTFGRKIEWMRENPQVCVEVDEIATSHSWASVILDGRYQELPDTPEFNPARQLAYTLLENRALWWQTAQASRQVHARHELSSPIFYRIHIDTITGHRAVPDPLESVRPLIRVLD